MKPETECDLKIIELIAKIYRAREKLHALWGDGYTEKMRVYRETVRAVAKGKGIEPLRAAAEMVEQAGDDLSPIGQVAVAVAGFEESES